MAHALKRHKEVEVEELEAKKLAKKHEEKPVEVVEGAHILTGQIIHYIYLYGTIIIWTFHQTRCIRR